MAVKVTVVPLTSFVHGSIDAHEGRPFACEKGLADEFERAGLVRIKRPPVQDVVQRTPQPDPTAVKATDDGAGQLSSASPAAPVSPTATSQPSAPGARRPRRGAA